jgi:hypothetical protein
MADAAEAYGALPRELSFNRALQTMTAFQDCVRITPEDLRATLWQEMPRAIASHRVAGRPGTVERRANKRPPKKQRYVNAPRYTDSVKLLGERQNLRALHNPCVELEAATPGA